MSTLQKTKTDIRINYDDPKKARLERLAAKKDLTLSQLMRKITFAYLEEQGKEVKGER